MLVILFKKQTVEISKILVIFRMMKKPSVIKDQNKNFRDHRIDFTFSIISVIAMFYNAVSIHI